MLQGNRLEIKQTGRTTTVPDNPKARLMYYFDCMCTVLDLQDDDISQLRDFRNYYLLSEDDTNKLLILCTLLEPRTLNDKCIFLNNDLESNNEFFELNAVTTRIAMTQSILIGGVQRKVQRIMMFRTEWMEKYFLQPYAHFAPRLANMLSDDDDQSRPAQDKVGTRQVLAIEAPPTRYVLYVCVATI